MSGTRISNLLGKITVVVVVICYFCLPAQAKYGGGTGKPNDPYLIYTAEQMNAIGADSNDWDKHFILMADIDLSGFTGTSFNIIGERYYDTAWVLNPFVGVFDGNGHAISNFTYTSTDRDCIGIFGYVEGTGEIKDLGLIDPDIDGGTVEYVGSLVGFLSGGTISRCNVEGGNASGTDYVGGLVGYNYEGTITYCYATNNVFGNSRVGGLVGRNSGWAKMGTITNSYATGSIMGDDYIGGLVGYNLGKITNCYSSAIVSGLGSVGGLVGHDHEGIITSSSATGNVTGTRRVGGMVGVKCDYKISDCYSTGSVTGEDYVGGLVGESYGNIIISNCYSTGSVLGTGTYVGGLVGNNRTWSTITNCYSAGDVNGHLDIGGLVGKNEEGNVIASFWDIETSGQATSDGGTGLSTEEMQMKVTFTDAGWDFEYIWWILEGKNYPRLCWEVKYGGGTGEPNDPYLIFTPEQMNAIGADSNDWDKHFKLMADIDLSAYTGTSFNIIGSTANPFTGVFDGNDHTISNFTYNSTGRWYIGLFGYVKGSNAAIKDLRLIHPNVDAETSWYVGSLVGYLSHGTISNCFTQSGSIKGGHCLGGLIGENLEGSILESYSESTVWGKYGGNFGGLVGRNYSGLISSCYAIGNVTLLGEGNSYAGGLVGFNRGIISNCYARGDVEGTRCIGGLVGNNSYADIYGDVVISNSYSSGNVSGGRYVGGLSGYNDTNAIVKNSFWDIEASGRTTSAGGTGLPTAQMQMMSTFTDAGWDFTTPVWIIDEGKYYPRLWWEFVPVLHAEPEITLGTGNTISWEPITGNIEYYAECSTDANFTIIVCNSDWITETSYEFTGLQLGRRYWYSVKARNAEGVESQWSNVESSLQCTLSDAVDIMLNANNLKSKNLKSVLINKINVVQEMIDEGLYENALNKLQNDILTKMNGCADTGEPDKNDWIITCEAQSEVYPLIIETIEHVKKLIE